MPWLKHIGRNAEWSASRDAAASARVNINGITLFSIIVFRRQIA